MKWPTIHTCHAVVNSPFIHLSKGEWRQPQPTRPPYGSDNRTCDYCGSIHPEDLIRLVRSGATVRGSDWKYGWPHKFYVYNIPNLLAGQIFMHNMGSATSHRLIICTKIKIN
jgi:hypothetical protein